MTQYHREYDFLVVSHFDLISLGQLAYCMDTLNTIASSTDGGSFEDALKVLGRVADAFDSPCLHKTDRELLYVVNVVKSRHFLPSLSSEESVCQDTMYDSSFDFSSDFDEEVELVELGDVSAWEHESSYPYASRRHGQRGFSFRQDDGTYDVNKMLLTSSPLDRLDRLARMELKKTGWFERVNRWTIVEMGLQGANVSTATPKTPSKKTSLHVGESGQRPSPVSATSPKGAKQTPRTPGRPERSGIERRHETPKRNHGMTPARSYETESDCFLGDFSRLSHWTTASGPSRASRPPRTAERSPQETQGRFGRAMRNFVKRMGPWTRPSPSRGSDVSDESEWTFASAM